MKIWGVKATTVNLIVTAVSLEKYDGNLCFKRYPEPDGKGISCTLTVREATQPGGRRSNTGRKIAAACWHCHRDVMKMIFMLNPEARIKTSFADYKGADNFHDLFEDTGLRNLGSDYRPLCYRDACECEK